MEARTHLAAAALCLALGAGGVLSLSAQAGAQRAAAPDPVRSNPARFQRPPAPIDSGALAELILPERPGTRVEHFEILPPGDQENADPPEAIGLVRWISTGLDNGGLYIENEVHLFAEETRLVHVEQLSRVERKLVWREVRPHTGRTVILDWKDEDPIFRSTEWSRGDMARNEFSSTKGVLLPLYTIELARGGSELSGPLPLYQPLGNALEWMEASTLPGGADGPAQVGALERVFEWRRADGSLAGSYEFRGEELLAFRWQAGGPAARRIEASRYGQLLRSHEERLAERLRLESSMESRLPPLPDGLKRNGIRDFTRRAD